MTNDHEEAAEEPADGATQNEQGELTRACPAGLKARTKQKNVVHDQGRQDLKEDDRQGRQSEAEGFEPPTRFPV
jgi:hypothetical protein